MNREVIRIEEPQEGIKPVEFTHVLAKDNGWEPMTVSPSAVTDLIGIDKVVYLGKCKDDGDMFCSYFHDKTIHFFKGHLNSGKY